MFSLGAPVHSAREVIKIKLALFMAQSIPSVPILPPAFVGHLSFCFGKAANAPPRDNTKISFSSKYLCKFIGNL